jgi:hypothetical protein
MVGGGEDPKIIREYPPLLNRKQKRVLYDELCCSRIEWSQPYHKRECSVTMQFDSNSKVNEHENDSNFASLVDIKSLYLEGMWAIQSWYKWTHARITDLFNAEVTPRPP